MLKLSFLFTIICSILFPGINGQDSIYVVKISWHTGYLIKVDSVSMNIIPALQSYDNYNYVDIGWGDKDFYMHSGNFDLFLAAKAILVPSPSVIKVTAYHSEPKRIAEWYNFAFLIEVEPNIYLNILKYISSFIVNDQPLKYNSPSSSFYRSKGSYWLFNTCNTWIAKGLQYTSKVSSFGIISAEGLYKELKKTGKLITNQ